MATPAPAAAAPAATSSSSTPTLSSKLSGDKARNFLALLANELEPPYTLAAFEEFLRTREHSEENLEFLDAVKSYRTAAYAPDSADAKNAILQIIQTFVIPGAPKEVNCPNVIRKKLLEDVQQKGVTDPAVFAPAEAKTLELMRLSSFPHFCRFVEGKQGTSPSVDQRPAGHQ
ncbi:hypothetical protein H9P43_008221 [Blastocladiella emersonii ATCC 22665]|nr:hypothetical protein H9P43_008221 [Blastocladiella emersonii ATCC 22665]